MTNDDGHFACLAVDIIDSDFGITDKIIQTKPAIGLAVAMATKTQRPRVPTMLCKIGQEMLPTPCANKNTVQKQHRGIVLIMGRHMAQQFQRIGAIVRLYVFYRFGCHQKLLVQVLPLH